MIQSGELLKNKDGAAQRLIWAGLVAAVAFLYFPLNQNLTGGTELTTAWDTWIPLLPAWTVPYLLALPLWGLGLAWVVWKVKGQRFRAFISASLLALGTATLIYAFYPTYVIRPSLEGTGWAWDLLRFVYANDQLYNAFPSGHVFQTMLLGLFMARWYPKTRWVWAGVVAVVVLSTLFTHQHNLPDPLGGAALAWGAYRLGTALFPEQARQTAEVTGLSLQPVRVNVKSR